MAPARSRDESPGERDRSRIDFRPKPAQKALFEKAAALEGQTLTEFLIRSAEERALRVLERHEVMTLRGEAAQKFVSFLIAPPPPSDRLRALFKLHDEDVESR